MINGTAQEFQNFAAQANKMMLDSWSTWTKQTVQSDSFASASSALMDWSTATHKMMTELQGQFMESLDIPKRSDLARISAQVQSLESRVLEQDDSQAEIKELLIAISAKLDTLSAAPVQGTEPAPPTTSISTSEVNSPVAEPSSAMTESSPSTAVKSGNQSESSSAGATRPRGKRGTKKS